MSWYPVKYALVPCKVCNQHRKCRVEDRGDYYLIVCTRCGHAMIYEKKQEG